MRPRNSDLAGRPAFVAALFFASGATALLYQVAFGKKLSTIFGATAYAVSAVLAAFMGGLALGSYLGGRFGSRIRRPLAMYGVAEVVVGVVCAVTPLLFDGIAAGYVSMVGRGDSLAMVSVARAVLAALVVVIPTMAMGVTLPLLARAIAARGHNAQQRASSRHRLAILYAVNTAGGAVGAVASAYWVLPTLGVYTTMRAAALVNLAIGALALFAGRRSAAAALEPSVAADREPTPKLLVGLAAASGVLVFAAEVVDTHLLALLIGNSAYAFGLMLAVFLTCLSAGAALAGRFEARVGRDRALSVGLTLAAFTLMVSLPIWGQLPHVFSWAGKHVSSWHGRELVRAGVAFAALALPTTAMGLTFPLLLRRVAGGRGVAGHVGRLTAINTLGSIVGAIATGYVALPALGSEWSLRLIAMAFATCAFVADRRRAFATLATAALVVAMPTWDMVVMTNGANVYFTGREPPDELLYVREDVHGGLTSVARYGAVRTMYTNGKFQGNDGAEIVAQRSFAHYPSLFVETHQRALVIGLGTGTTLGTIAAYPYDTIEVAEISPSIVHAAEVFFSGPNRGSLKDPRVELLLNDGRNVLLLSREPYDLITIELTSVWFAGAANLYSREFYELCRERLRPRGVLQQWVQLHHIRRTEFAVVLRTVRAVFEHVALFVSGGQGILVASSKPLRASRARLEQLGRRDAIAATLADRTLPGMLDQLMFSGPDLDRFVAESAGSVVSTDENLYLEYATPKGNVLDYYASFGEMVRLMMPYRTREPALRHLGP